MPYYSCPGCEQLFHDETGSPFVWCHCGQPLDCGSLVPELDAPTEQPAAEKAPEPAEQHLEESVEDSADVVREVLTGSRFRRD